VCGIAGKFNFLVGLGAEADVSEEVIRASESISHRGPDSSGHYSDSKSLMINTRLMITGDESGKQPIYSDDDRYVLVLNGEIYNYKALRSELIKKGVMFRSNSDTEVLLQHYLMWGESGLKHLNGMFSFCLYDREKSEMILVRDRFGVKPLYYTVENDTLFFASEIKALKPLGCKNYSVGGQGLSAYLSLMYIPEPWSIYDKICKLRSGYILKFSGGKLESSQYYSESYDKISLSYEDAKEEVSRLFHASVNRQIDTDVKTGVLLSGGLDSRSVLAASAAQNRADVHAYTIGFSDSAFNESTDASYWAKAFNREHHVFGVNQDDFSSELIRRFKHLDEPYSLWCNVASSCMAKNLRNKGVKVVLGGDGGDELFLGYPTIQAALIAGKYNDFLPVGMKNILSGLVNKMPAGSGKIPLTFALKSFFSSNTDDFFKTFFQFKEVVKSNELSKLLTPEAYSLIKGFDPYECFSQYAGKTKNLGVIDAMSYLDKKVFLSGCSLAGADNAYMAHGVELRVPFLDNDLDSFVCSLPESIRFKFFKLKPLLNESFKGNFPAVQRLPKNVKYNYRKSGFEVPIQKWLTSGRSGEAVKTVLGRAWTNRVGFFRWPEVERILNEQISGKQNNERVIQTMFVLHLFLDGNYEPTF
jgi:asparagine synthase (glutamine-hydrolysing)